MGPVSHWVWGGLGGGGGRRAMRCPWGGVARCDRSPPTPRIPGSNNTILSGGGQVVRNEVSGMFGMQTLESSEAAGPRFPRSKASLRSAAARSPSSTPAPTGAQIPH